MHATVESQRWGDVTDWPRLTVERTERGFELKKNADTVVADIEYWPMPPSASTAFIAATPNPHVAVARLRIDPEHRGGPALRALLALVAAKAHGLGLPMMRIEPGPSSAFFDDLKALGFTTEKP